MLILPVVAPIGITAEIEVGDMILGAPALIPLNLTSITLERFVPEIVTVLPIAAVNGVKELIAGGLITVKMAELVRVPDGMVILIVPVAAVVGTIAVI